MIAPVSGGTEAARSHQDERAVSSSDLRLDTAPAHLEPAEEPTDNDAAGHGPYRRWRTLRRIALGAAVVILVFAIVASGLTVWSVRRSFPDYDGALSLPGIDAPVTVYRDEYGVPQVYASSATDLFKAEGYVHAQDRFWEMDFRRHVTSGRLAELFGASQVPTDAFLRTLGWRRVAEQEWRLLSPATRGYLQAYADGVNAWIAGHGGGAPSSAKGVEYVLVHHLAPGYTVSPWDPIDSLAWLKALAWDLRDNMGEEINRAAMLARGLTREQLAELYPPYPFQRNRPIVGSGTVRDGVFDPGPTTAPATAPASYAGSRPAIAEPVWRSVAPQLDALSGALRSVPTWLGVTGTGIGSNSWVISGSLSTTGKPLLANDPHLSPSVPNIWYQVGLHCECAFNVTGFSMSGVPGVIIGHNARIAWGLTNLNPDVTDLYLEKINGDRYFDGTTWRSLITRRETIAVAGGPAVPITVRATEHGPLLSDRSNDLLSVAQRPPIDASGSPLQHVPPAATPSLDVGAAGIPAPAADAPYAVALRWTALDPGRTIEALFALDTAANWTEFRRAAALLDAPAQGMIYADVDGNIGYQAPGRIPVRGRGDGRWPAPGWDPAYDWTGYIPFAALPYTFNPPGGMIVAANQPPVGPPYPYLITADWSYGYRGQRILDMLAERTAHHRLGVEDMRQMQIDDYNGFAPVLVPALLAASRRAASPDSPIAKARDLLVGWDFQEAAETPARSSAAAAFYNATMRNLLRRTFDELPPEHRPGDDEATWETLRWLLTTPNSWWWDDKATKGVESMNDILPAAMSDAVNELTDRLGADPDKWRWGALHTLTLENTAFGDSGIAPIEWLFNRGPVAVSGGGGAVNATTWAAAAGYEAIVVPSMRMIVDLADLDRSRWIQLSGTSGHAFHANYTDQLELWRTGRNTSMLWTRASIAAAARHTLTIESAHSR
jgi:penicillin amidase